MNSKREMIANKGILDGGLRLVEAYREESSARCVPDELIILREVFNSERSKKAQKKINRSQG